MALFSFIERFDDALDWDVQDPFLADENPLAPVGGDCDDPLVAVDHA